MVDDATREFYSKRGFSGRVGFGSRPAVLVIDLIIGFTDIASPLGCNLEGPLGETLRILVSARNHHVPVFFTTVEYDPSLNDAGLFPRKASGLKWLVEGSKWVQLDPRLERREGEILFRKKYASAFFGTVFSSALASASVDTIIITGATTSGCVRATAVDALQYGYHAIVPAEAVGDRAQAPHAANLFDIDAKYGDVVSVDEVLQYLEKLSGTAKASAS